MSVVQKVKDGLARRPKYHYKSAVTGRYVSAWYAITHPKTTYREHTGRG